MNRQTITPTDESHWLSLRTKDLTSTDIAALFGLSPYATAFEVWHRKKSGDQVSIKVNDRMKWGNRLESVVASGIAEDQKWTVRHFKDYVRLPDLRIGSSFDFRIYNYSNCQTQPHEVDGILEIKTVDARAFRSGWLVEDDSIEAPPHIELQLQHQMLVSGLRWGYIGALVGGNDVRLIRRDADDAIHRKILAKAAAFWASIDANEPPPPVYPEDAQAVIALNQAVKPGLVVNDDTIISMAEEYRHLGEQVKAIGDQRDTLKARLLEHIGEAEKCKAGNYSISAGYRGEVVVPEHTRAGYRDFRVTEKKAK